MTQQPWTDEDRGFLASHEDWTAKRIAEELGRSITSVNEQRRRLRGGWEPRQDKPSCWSKAEDDFLIATRQWKASVVAEQLGRSTSAVHHRRQQLRTPDGKRIAFAGNFNPRSVGTRPLIAKTCRDCGRLLQASWFRLNTRTGSWTTRCHCCRRKTRDEKANNSERAQKQRRDFAQQMQNLTIANADRAGSEYTDTDFEVLANPDLTVFEKALKIHRTYRATVIACSRYGYESKHGLGEPTNQWIIDNPNEAA